MYFLQMIAQKGLLYDKILFINGAGILSKEEQRKEFYAQQEPHE